jgi:hypothetical protein
MVIRHVHALALYWPHDEASYVFLGELLLQAIQIVERYSLAARQEFPEAFSEVLIAVNREGTQGETVEGVVQVQRAGPPGG